MTKSNAQAKIEPTIGRVLWFYPRGAQPPQQPHAAVVAYVHDDGRVNLGALTPDGVSYSATSIMLIQPGVEEPPNGNYACWMPYQQGQAKRKVEHGDDEDELAGWMPNQQGQAKGPTNEAIANDPVPQVEAKGLGTAGESAVAEHGPTSPGHVRPGGKRHGR